MEVILTLLLTLVAAVAAAAPPADPQTLTTLTVEQAEELAGRRWYPRLTLDSLTELDPKAAAVLATHEGGICFAALEDLSPESARALAAHQPLKKFGSFNLEFRALRQLAPATAEVLATHAGNLRLPALERLESPALARKLASQWGELKIGLTELTPEIAAILATNEGVFEDRTRPGQVFRRADGARSVLWFAALPELSAAAAIALAGHQGVLVLNELSELSPAAAAGLARRAGGSLILNGLTRLSAETAEALAAYDGELAMRALPAMSLAAAKALKRHQGRLHLTGLVDPTPEVLAVLRMHPQVRLPQPPPVAAGNVPNSSRQNSGHVAGPTARPDN